jgi:N-carbamoyl-L-amino-acid hydrolase
MSLRIDPARLRRDLEELGRFGRDPRGGLSRPSFSRADLEARDWLKGLIVEAGLELREDGAGNIFGRRPGPGRTIMAGSHIDTVVQGGMFDGAVGVLAALEGLRRVREEGVATTRAMEVAAFTDEEGNLVGDFLGSRAFAGLLDPAAVRTGTTSFGTPLAEILSGTRFSADSILGAARERPDLEAYLELHIEQGPVLDAEDVPVGVVEAIAGKRWRLCSFTGRASHAGTTPFELRRDAFLGLADFAQKATRLAAAASEGSVATIGRVTAHPGAFSIIPGKVDFTLDARSADPNGLAGLEKALLALAAEIAATRGLAFASKLVDATEPVRIEDRMRTLIQKEADGLGYATMALPSGAGHDAQIVASLCPVGMIFIPSPDGISHAPEESVRWDDLEKGANVLLASWLRLAAS